jgi:colanic acid biosynthesis glycosyl transferase WcaI
MRILFVVHHFQPEPNFFVGLPFAKVLAQRGHKVEVLTGFPYYPGNRIYEGYKVRFMQRQIMDGIPVIRVPIYPSHDSSSLRRVACYMSYALSASTIGASVVKKADVAYVGQGPVTVGWPALVVKYLRRIPYILHVMDLWPDTLPATGMFNSPAGLKMLDLWCRLMYRSASTIVVPSLGIKEKLIARGVPSKKVTLIYNWCDDALIYRGPKDEHLAVSLGMSGKFNVVFAGNIGKLQAIGPVIEAAGLLAADCPDVQFVFFGGGVEVESLKQKVTSMKLTNVLFHPRKSINEIGPILCCADVLLVHLQDDPVFRITVPSKTQAYMAIGRPVLMGIKGDAARIVEDAEAGLSCEPENPQSIAEAVRKLHEMPQEKRDEIGANGQRFYDEQMSFQIALERFERVFVQAAGRQQ